MMKENEFDMIIIGSGMGGLTVASLYARLRNQRVLVLERHFKLGGFTHTFRREGKYEWDVGLHYLGNLQKGSPFRVLMDSITGGKVDFNQMPDIFEKFVFPEFTFEVSSDVKKLKKSLFEKFPDEKKSIEEYFSDVKDASNWFGRYATMKSVPPVLGSIINFFNSFGGDPSSITTREYLDKKFKSQKLKSILAGQWGDYGLPPGQSSFVIHALIVEHYLQGGFYPDGSARKISESVKDIVEEFGGKMLVNNKVTEIILENNFAKGVKVIESKGNTTQEREYYAPIIISDAGAYTTYLKLLPKTYTVPFAEELEKLAHSPTNATLYLGLNRDPRELGFFGENYWIFSSLDHDKVFDEKNSALEGNPSLSYLSFPSLKDTKAVSHTAEIITLIDYKFFEKWKDQEWKNRDESYKELKEKITEGLINSVDKHYPNFSSMIEYKELSTPLTNEGFTGHREGTIFGLPCTPERYAKKWLGAKTPIENLYLTGADAASPGIAGAMAGGFSALAHILGVDGLLGLFKEIKKLKIF